MEFLNILVGFVWSVICEGLNVPHIGGFLVNPLQFPLNWLFHVVKNVNMLNLCYLILQNHSHHFNHFFGRVFYFCVENVTQSSKALES